MEEDEEDDEEVEQWGMRRLTTSRADMNLLRHCNRLEKLHLLRLVPQFAQEVPTLALLSNCPELKELVLPPTADAEEMEGLTDALLTLTSIDKLSSFRLLWPEQAELLTTGKRAAPVVEVAEEEEVEVVEEDLQGQEPSEEPLSEQYALAALKQLEITVVGNLTPPQQSRFVSRLLQQRPGLEGLVLPGQCAVVLESLVSNEWVCLNLTELTISLIGPGDDEVEGHRIWFSFYEHLGRLRELVTLHIYCSRMQKSSDDGTMLLQGAVNLKRLTIHDQEGAWTQQEVVTLMAAAPTLSYLNLEPVADEEYQSMSVWLEGVGKAHILAAT
ncbi:hypothetical protein BGX23_003251, partial [Mortierella sp. AD031]